MQAIIISQQLSTDYFISVCETRKILFHRLVVHTFNM